MTDTLWKRLRRGVLRLHQTPERAALAGPGWAERIMGAPLTDRLSAKQGRSTARWILETEGERLSVYIKRHYQLPWWQGWLAALWPDRGWSPAFQEVRHLHWAKKQGIPVPEVVVAGEYIGPWGRFRSFLAVEELTDMLPLHEAVPRAAARLSPPRFRAWKRGLTHEVARLTVELHARRYFHRDLYLCHFFIPNRLTEEIPSWHGRVHLIDLHRLGRHALAPLLGQAKDLAQLLYASEVAGIDLRDRLRFWHVYARSRRPRSLWMQLLRSLVVFKARRYLRHNAKMQAQVNQRAAAA